MATYLDVLYLSSTWRILSGLRETVNLILPSRGSAPRRESRGCFVADQAAAGGIRARAARSRPRRPGDRVLHLPVAHGEARAPRAEPHRHLRQDGQVLEAAEWGAGETGGPPAQGASQARAGG